MESIKEFGFKSPIIIVDKYMIIINGHTRFKAAKRLQMETVPVIIATDLTPEQVKAFRLADNKTAEFAEWDFDLLDGELKDILNMDMSVFGFDEIESDEEREPQEDDYDPAVPATPKSKPGDIYQLGEHRLMCELNDTPFSAYHSRIKRVCITCGLLLNKIHFRFHR